MDCNMCRACLGEIGNGESFSLLEKSTEMNLSELLFLIAGIEIQQSNEFPTCLCCGCKTKLVEAYMFRCLCIESDNWLKSEEAFQLASTTSKEDVPKAFDTISNAEWNEELESDLDYLDKIVNPNLSNDQDDGAKDVDICSNVTMLEMEQADKPYLVDLDAEDKTETNIQVDGTECSNEQLLKKDDFSCATCDKEFTDEKSLKRHENYHKKHKTKCPICPKYFSHKSNLKRHLTVHKGKKALVCDKCEKTFSQPSALYDHIKTHRTNDGKDEYLMECEQCGEKTGSHALFNTHMKTVHKVTGNVRAFQCKVCNMRFVSKQGMYRHIDNIHENNRQNLRNRNKNFLCNTCGKSFYTNFHLHVHVRSHTGERPFRCQYCDKAFAQMSGLKMHTFIHTGEKPFKCKICSKSFNQYGHVREHMLTHSDVRPHVCNVCNHSFRVKGNLTAHMMIHMGKKPHVCELCGKRFLQSTKLKQHKLKNHIDAHS